MSLLPQDSPVVLENMETISDYSTLYLALSNTKKSNSFQEWKCIAPVLGVLLQLNPIKPLQEKIVQLYKCQPNFK